MFIYLNMSGGSNSEVNQPSECTNSFGFYFMGIVSQFPCLPGQAIVSRCCCIFRERIVLFRNSKCSLSCLLSITNLMDNRRKGIPTHKVHGNTRTKQMFRVGIILLRYHRICFRDLRRRKFTQCAHDVLERINNLAFVNYNAMTEMIQPIWRVDQKNMDCRISCHHSMIWNMVGTIMTTMNNRLCQNLVPLPLNWSIVCAEAKSSSEVQISHHILNLVIVLKRMLLDLDRITSSGSIRLTHRFGQGGSIGLR